MLYEPISDQETIDKLDHLKAGLVEDAINFDLDWIATHGWVCVPVMPPTFMDDDAERLASAFRATGCSEVFVIATEGFVGDNPPHLIGGSGGTPKYFRVETTKEGLRAALSTKCGLFCYLLAPADRAAAFLYTVEDYNLVAGPSHFVQGFLGCDVEAAWRQAHEQVEDLVANIIPRPISSKPADQPKTDQTEHTTEFEASLRELIGGDLPKAKYTQIVKRGESAKEAEEYAKSVAARVREHLENVIKRYHDAYEAMRARGQI